jgi:hypothetical protein
MRYRDHQRPIGQQLIDNRIRKSTHQDASKPLKIRGTRVGKLPDSAKTAANLLDEVKSESGKARLVRISPLH